MTQEDRSTNRGWPSAPLNPIEESAILQAFWRANADFEDPVAKRVVAHLVTEEMAEKYRADNSVYAEIHLASLRAADKALSAWADRQDAPSIVLLGGGLDGRAERRLLPIKGKIYNIDTPPILARYGALTATAPIPSVAVPASLTKPDALLSALGTAGWESTTPTCFIAEGVLEFTGPARMLTLLNALIGRAAQGSMILLQALDPCLVVYAEQIGDETFPWRKLPDAGALLQQIEGAEVLELSTDAPTLDGPESSVALSHVYQLNI
ncbi:class I SAM-dependent methyltransferase [Cognatiyoonia sp. IB215446]|uniref:class I SAM-dependent methyltransferase n=1 Tax=Cognatiyoonia sp. IB215446 TaxID=3097355 RepID=UPI002A0B7899|nr:class I SAM-dependent methyltransferase [Cognatiyoonia sp. IB215446]MDX8348126.1 class I SAM-dependent methyltransferase [Cognatiyoonia sp. IB215446]